MSFGPNHAKIIGLYYQQQFLFKNNSKIKLSIYFSNLIEVFFSDNHQIQFKKTITKSLKKN